MEAEYIATHGEAIVRLFRQGLKVYAKTGEIVARGDDTTSWVFLIEKGYIEEFSINDEGREYLQLIYKAGELFPLVWATIGVKKRLFYQALDATTLWKLPRSEFIGAIQAEAGPVNLAVFRQMGVQFSAFVDRLDNLQYKTADQRIIYRLLFLAARFGQKYGSSIIIQVPLNHQLIADSINLTRETVSREMQTLVKAGLISHPHKRVVIENLKELVNKLEDPVSLDHWGLG